MITGHAHVTSNKYLNWYLSIIDRAKQSPSQGYTEKHHILPRCMGGNNSKLNIVRLSAREHYIVHLLLTKFTTNSSRYSMLNAVVAFKMHKKLRLLKFNSHTFERIRSEYFRHRSEMMKGKPSTFNNPAVLKQCNKTRQLNGTNPFITHNPMYDAKSIRKKLEKTSGKYHYLKSRNAYFYANKITPQNWIRLPTEEISLQNVLLQRGWKYATFFKYLNTEKSPSEGPMKDVIVKREYINEDSKNHFTT